jgi:hypothetical protein
MLDQIVPIAIALAGSAAFWGYLTQKNKQNHERMMKSDAATAEFNESLREQVDILNAKVDRLLSEKEELMIAVGKLSADLAAAQITIKHLEEKLMSR